jgi:hypothetical protein
MSDEDYLLAGYAHPVVVFLSGMTWGVLLSIAIVWWLQ